MIESGEIAQHGQVLRIHYLDVEETGKLFEGNALTIPSRLDHLHRGSHDDSELKMNKYDEIVLLIQKQSTIHSQCFLGIQEQAIECWRFADIRRCH